MLWHLCNPDGVSQRTTDADSEFWAKRRFAPLRPDWFVVSDASYQLGFRTGQADPTPYRMHRVSKDPKKAARNARYKAKCLAEGKSKRRRWEPKDNPKQARIITGKHKEAIRAANILRGIENRRAKREQSA